MKLNVMNTNLKTEQFLEYFKTFMTALEQTANRWSSGIFVLIKTIAALFGLTALTALIVVSTQWFIAVYGVGMFLLTLILSTFALSALSTMTANKQK